MAQNPMDGLESNESSSASNMTDLGSNETDVNQTSMPADMVFGEAQIISIAVYSPLFMVAATLNLVVLVKLIRVKRKQGLSRLNTLVLHLVLADLSVIFLMMPMEIFWSATVSWWAGDFLCRICSFFRIFGLFLSSNMVVCISIDRYLAIVKPFSVRSSSGRVHFMIKCSWAVAILLSAPQCYIFHLEYHPEYKWYGQCVTYGIFKTRQGEFLYFFMGMIFLYIIPFVTILVTYGGILTHLHRKTTERRTDRANAKSQTGSAPEVGHSTAALVLNGPASGSTQTVVQLRRSSPGVIGRAKINTIKITMSIVAAFLICWTPYYVICLWFWADYESFSKIDYRIQKFMFMFACTISCANPLIYGFFSWRRPAPGGVFASRNKDNVRSTTTKKLRKVGNRKIRLAERRSHSTAGLSAQVSRPQFRRRVVSEDYRRKIISLNEVGRLNSVDMVVNAREDAATSKESTSSSGVHIIKESQNFL